MSHDFENEIFERFREMPGPEGEDALIAQSVGRAMHARRRQRRRRRIIATAVAVALLMSGGAFAYVKLTEPGVRFGPLGTPDAPAKRASAPELQGLPWLWQPGGAKSVADAPAATISLRFPEGVSYEEAAESLYRSVLGRGELPTGSEEAAPMPRGVVAELTGGRVRLNLAAPFGFDPRTGSVRVPVVRLPRTLAPERAAAILTSVFDGDDLVTLPPAAQIFWPPLPECERVVDGAKPVPCPFSSEP